MATSPWPLVELQPLPSLRALQLLQLFQGWGMATMVSGGKTTITLPSGASTAVTISGFGNGSNTGKITKTNIIARNGVVHVIDKILIPY